MNAFIRLLYALLIALTVVAFIGVVTITLLVVTVPIVLGGLYVFKRSGVIGEGLALGGVGTTVYAIVSAGIADTRILRFIAVSLLLVSVLLVSHFRFTKEKVVSSR